jgi:UDP-N-acetyl-D-glucosamine dehydrogenase
VSFHDPFVEEVRRGTLQVKRTTLDERALRESDCVLLLTPHDTYDLEALVRHSRLLFDARNATKGLHRPAVVVL